MKFFNSYQFRLFISFWFFGIVLVVMYLLVGYSLIYFSRQSSEMADFELKNEVAYFRNEYHTSNRVMYPNSRFFQSYLNAADLPQHLRSKIEHLRIGYHSIHFDYKDRPRTYHLAVMKKPDRPELFYLVYDYTRYVNEYIEFQISKTNKRFILALAITGFLGIIVALLVSNRLSAPLKSLALRVENLDPEQLPTHFSHDFKNDEVGILAKALEISMQRIAAFIEREKNFTRDSSHELRTPVTIIKGAVEVIQQLPEYQNKSLALPIERIERSTKHMEDTIEAFLWLARENFNETKNGSSCLAGDAARNAMEENRYLVAAKPVTVDMIVEDNPLISVPEIIFRIAAINLIRNAFLYTNEGQITIRVQSDCLHIANSGAQIPPGKLRTIKKPFQKGTNSKGFGLGLAIVERLCGRFDLNLKIESDAASDTRVILSFGKKIRLVKEQKV